jgi:hypothetical protein
LFALPVVIPEVIATQPVFDQRRLADSGGNNIGISWQISHAEANDTLERQGKYK